MEVDKEKIQLRKADIIASILLLIASALFLFFALLMPAKFYIQATGQPAGIFTAPGIFPILLAGILIVESILLFRAGLKGAKGLSIQDLREGSSYIRTKTFKRLVIVVGLLLFYIFVLLSRVRYDMATFVYLFSTMLIFRRPKYSIVKIFIICVVFSLAISLAFKHLFRIPLP
jgi:hypothetical protein